MPMMAVARLGTAYAAIVAVILVLGLTGTIEAGSLAVVQILSPHLALLCLVLVPVAYMSRSRALGIALLAVLGLFLVRFGSDWVSFPQMAPAGGE